MLVVKMLIEHLMELVQEYSHTSGSLKETSNIRSYRSLWFAGGSEQEHLLCLMAVHCHQVFTAPYYSKLDFGVKSNVLHLM